MKKTIFFILLIVIIVSVYKTNEEYAYIPNDAIRLRVIPNSNNSRDIYIKEKVKSYLEDNLYNLTEDTSDINQARIIIKDSIPSIESYIDNLFLVNNYQESFDINYGYNYFPEKVYKGNTYNEGYYESIVITIGEGKGDNWWCVLFPNLCLIDTNKNYESLIKKIINKYSK